MVINTGKHMVLFRYYLSNIRRSAAFSLFPLLFLLLNSSCSPPRHLHFQAPPPDPESLSARLYLQYDKWKGTPYRKGGLGRKGVDCSGLVYLIYRDLLGKDLPRTTAKQIKTGSPVALSSLRSGDLVFFKTGWFSRHVGIYLEESLFLHASTSKGVTISSLREKYWENAFSVAKRVDG